MKFNQPAILNKTFILALASLLNLHALESSAQRKYEDFIFNKELEQTAQLIVMLSVDYDGEESGVGSGIIFGRDNDRLLIATASHVVQKGSLQAKNIAIRLKSAPEKLLKATVLKHIYKGEFLDLAVLSVEGLARQGINACAIPFNRLRRWGDLERKDEVIPIGNPNGLSWVVPVETDKIAAVTETEIVFQSNNIKSGHSGGALIDTNANLVGMITADKSPLGHAMTLDALFNQLKEWGYPVLLSNASVRDERYDLPLHKAADSGNIAEMKKLLALCNNPNEIDFQYRTPLHYAALNGNLPVMSLLLNSGAMVDVSDFNGMHPVDLAVSQNHVEAVKALIKSGAKVNNKTEGGLTALFWAIDKNIDPEIARMLIQAGANVNAQDEEKNTCLHFAVQSGNLEIVKALIGAGASLEAVNAMQNTPLRQAVLNDHLEMLRLLIDSGAKPDTGPSSKVTGALQMAALYAQNIEILKTLIKAGAGVNVKNESGDTPLHYVLMRKDTDVAKLLEFMTVLLAAGADANAKNNEGVTPLMRAKTSQANASNSSDENNNRMKAVETLLRKYGGR